MSELEEFVKLSGHLCTMGRSKLNLTSKEILEEREEAMAAMQGNIYNSNYRYELPIRIPFAHYLALIEIRNLNIQEFNFQCFKEDILIFLK